MCRYSSQLLGSRSITAFTTFSAVLLNNIQKGGVSQRRGPPFLYLVVHAPFVKSGIITGLPPARIDSSESAVMHIHAAVS